MYGYVLMVAGARQVIVAPGAALSDSSAVAEADWDVVQGAGGSDHRVNRLSV